MGVAAILSVIFTLTGIALAVGAWKVLRMDTRSSIHRERFFGHYFRFFWVVACGLASACLFKAAWLVRFSPFAAAMHVIAVPLLAILLTIVARGILPWLYRRKFRR
jgi:hypothetical protein